MDESSIEIIETQDLPTRHRDNNGNSLGCGLMQGEGWGCGLVRVMRAPFEMCMQRLRDAPADKCSHGIVLREIQRAPSTRLEEEFLSIDGNIPSGVSLRDYVLRLLDRLE